VRRERRNRSTVGPYQGNAMVHLLKTELANATAEDEAAKKEALDTGLIATKPLTVKRLQQLCAMGERMMQAAVRKARAELALAQR
jgi:hypothetical protein